MSIPVQRITALRYSCLAALVLSIIFTATSLFTEDWFQMIMVRLSPEKRVIGSKVAYQKGLWEECLLNRVTMAMSCGDYGHVKKLVYPVPQIHPNVAMEPRSYIKVVRGFMIASLVCNCLTLLSTIILLLWKRQFFMDALSFQILVTNVLLCIALSTFVYWNETIVYASVMAGYSQILGWLSFSLLLVANIFSVMSRLDPVRAREKQALYA